jgi:hypothetical protein
LHSLWDFLGEATEVLTHADSRLWRTLVPLVLRPGFLTLQFIEGRRASYLSPFRLYFVISILFFVVVSATGARTGHGNSALGSSQATAATVHPPNPDIDKLCRDSVSPVPGPSWIRQAFFDACERSQADQGRALREMFIRNLGRAMFLFLPVLAAFMKLLYRKPLRSYVTHLVLLVHNHAFVFLLMSGVLAALYWLRLDPLLVWIIRGLICYLIYYLYRSMQRVYAQSWPLTLVKFTAVLAAYLACAALTVFLTGLYSAEIL